jgi:FKBP-type peptidyl-prolyl cis-trans isomerase FkpA
MRPTLTRSVVFLAFVILAACSKAPTAPSNSAPYSQVDLTVGNGAAVVAGQTLTVDYTGWLYDESKPDKKGPVFDTSLGDTPFTFTLGGDGVIAGWNRGVVGMQVGGERRLVIPPSLAYGARRSVAIPPFSTLVFDVKLLSVE